jgi:DNA primase
MDRLIPHSQIVEIQQATDIVELISSYIPLKKAGANYKALCPFHEEKTASFSVNATKQIFHCFGCHKGGNVYGFVMAYDKVDFPQAVKMLAERAGIRLANNQPKDDVSREKRAEFLKVNRLATNYYHECLLKSRAAEPARVYLAKRGFNQSMIAKFLLGCALPGWSNLVGYAREKNIPLKHLEELGLILPRREQSGYYDRFRNRLMFPIFNPRDGVVGFGGRALDDAEPVYLNSPENILFNKGKSLYGLNFAKESCQKSGQLCIVEGYTDVIMSCQHGVEYIVATLGTALTTDHIKSIRRYVNKVVVVYDADAAGKMASARSLDLFLAEEMDLFVARLPEGLDPYDCLIRKDGKPVFQKCIDEAVELFAYRLEVVKHKYNLNNIGEKSKAVDEMLDTVGAVPNPVKRNLYLKQLGEVVGVGEDILRGRFKLRAKKPAGDRAPEAVVLPPLPVQQQDIRAGEQIIEIMLGRNEFIPVIKNSVNLDDYPTDLSRRIAEKIFENYNDNAQVTAESLLNYIAADIELSSAVSRIDQEAAQKKISDYDQYLRDWLSFIEKRQRRTKERPALKQQLKEAQLKGDQAAINQILSKLQRAASSN